MQKTGKSRRDGVVAMTLALAVNGLIAWQLQALLSPRFMVPDGAAASLQVVWIAAVPPRRAAVIAPARQPAVEAHPLRAIDRPPTAHPRPDPVAAPELPSETTSARPMTAVYLQQARQWAQQHPVATAPADPFASRRVALADQPASRFRLKRPLSPADAVAAVGKLFGGAGYTTDDCDLIRGRILGLVVGGDEQAAQSDLDFERRHCNP